MIPSRIFRSEDDLKVIANKQSYSIQSRLWRSESTFYYIHLHISIQGTTPYNIIVNPTTFQTLRSFYSNITSHPLAAGGTVDGFPPDNAPGGVNAAVFEPVTLAVVLTVVVT